MKSFCHEGIKVEIFESAKEWGETFYNLPDNAVLDEKELKELNGEINGFACLEDNTISLYVPMIDDDELEETIAHEIGHLVEGGFKKNPPDKSRYNKRHELKANHYQDYYKLVKKIYELTLLQLNKI